MRHNKHLQELADKCARKSGYFCAFYIGKRGDEFVYSPISKKSRGEIEIIGLPSVILIDNNKAYMRHGWESMEILSETKFRDLKKGRAIYNEFVRKVEHNDFSSRTECKYITEIVENQRALYERPVSKDELYKFLEIADRFGMRLKLEPYDWCKDRHDGWVYYLKLVK